MKKVFFKRIFCLFLSLLFAVSLIGCCDRGSGSKYLNNTQIVREETIVQSITDVNPSTELKVSDNKNFYLIIPADSLTSRYSIDITKVDLSEKSEDEIIIEAKYIGLPDGYIPTSNFYDIHINDTKNANIRASIAMNTSVWLNKQASLMLSAFEKPDWNSFDYYIAVLDGNNGKDTWYFVPVTSKDTFDTVNFLIESNSLGKVYCVAKRFRYNPSPVDPTPVDPTPVDPTPVDPTPVDPTPVDPTPVDPTPVDPDQKVVVNSLEISSNLASFETDANKKFTQNPVITLNVQYTGKIDLNKCQSIIKLYSFANFVFSNEIKAKSEGGIYIYSCLLTPTTTTNTNLTYVLTLPLKNQEYNKVKHPISTFIDASVSINTTEYRPTKPLSISLVPPVDPEAPKVAATAELVEIAQGATNIGLRPTLDISFTKSMKEEAKSAVKLTEVGGQDVPLAYAWHNNHQLLKITLSADLKANTKYTLSIDNDTAIDSEDVKLEVFSPLSFTTIGYSNPEVVAASPSNEATNLPTNTVVAFTFSEELANSLSINDFSLKVNDVDTAFGELFVFNYSNKMVTFTPKTKLAYGTKYELTAKTTILSVNNMPLQVAKTISFTTSEALIPVALSVFPQNGDAVWFDKIQKTDNNKIVINFNQRMDLNSLKYAFVINRDNVPMSQANYSIELSEDKKEMIVTLSSGNFEHDVSYSFQLANSAQSEEGVGLQEALSVNYPKRVFISGAGTENEPYELYTAACLDNVRDYLDKHFKQMQNIDLTNYSGENCTETEGWLPIGDENNYFTGVYDGNGYKVSGLFINRSDTNSIGLFGYIASGKIINIGVEISSKGVSGASFVGGLIGNSQPEDTEISNCYVKGGKVIGGQIVGGLVGHAASTNISNCYATCDIDGQGMYVGGLVGNYANSNYSIKNCYATGDVVTTITGQYIGGLVGYAQCDIYNCYTSGNVITPLGKSVSFYIGGLVGDYACADSKIVNSAALNNEVTGEVSINRLVGNSGTPRYGGIYNCYANSAMSGTWTDTSEGTTSNKNGKGVTLEECKGSNFWTTASNWESNNLWDPDVWEFHTDGFPTLKNMPE